MPRRNLIPYVLLLLLTLLAVGAAALAIAQGPATVSHESVAHPSKENSVTNVCTNAVGGATCVHAFITLSTPKDVRCVTNGMHRLIKASPDAVTLRKDLREVVTECTKQDGH
jgi:hypothetical protein